MSFIMKPLGWLSFAQLQNWISSLKVVFFWEKDQIFWKILLSKMFDSTLEESSSIVFQLKIGLNEGKDALIRFLDWFTELMTD